MQSLIKKMDIKKNEYIPYGINKGKINISILERLKEKEEGKLILVTAINPTKAGEGKTTVSIGLAQGLNAIGENVCLALREPSLGPVFGLKGGATGGGKSSLTPSEDINLHFNGDFHAIQSAHNLLSALIDSHIYHGNDLDIKDVLWPRTMDMNDRSLRMIETSIRKDRFVITAASEIMAILALSTSISDLKSRLSRILIGYNNEGREIYAKDLGAEKPMAVLLKDAIHPNIVETIDGVPALVHCGPFANIAHGCNSIIATKMALRLSDYVVTEAGFGADLGMQKFLDLKRRYLNKNVDLVVLVVTVRAIKAHGEAEDYNVPNIVALQKGFEHIDKHIENIKKYELPFVIALNHFYNDEPMEVAYVADWATERGYDIAVSKGFELGAQGTRELAELVLDKISKEELPSKYIYDITDTIQDKIDKIAKEIYGANNVVYGPKALKQLEKMPMYNDFGVCIAKTPMSFSGDPLLHGVPKDFDLEINELSVSSGAGFIVAKTKGINVMPGLNDNPNAYHMDIDDDGNVNLNDK